MQYLKVFGNCEGREVVLDGGGVHRAWGSQQPVGGSDVQVLGEKQEVAARS